MVTYMYVKHLVIKTLNYNRQFIVNIKINIMNERNPRSVLHKWSGGLHAGGRRFPLVFSICIVEHISWYQIT